MPVDFIDSPTSRQWLAAPARDRSYGVDGLLVGGARPVAVLSAEVAGSAVGEIKAFGNRMQMGEAVQTNAPDLAPPLC